MPGMGRAANFERPFVPALYDLDVRVTSRLVWGTSVAEQARFAAAVIGGATGPVLEVPVGTGLVTRKALRASGRRSAGSAARLAGCRERRSGDPEGAAGVGAPVHRLSGAVGGVRRAAASDAPLLVAVDLSAAVLRRARRRLGDQAVYVRADVAHLPFRAEAFHAVHSGNGFHLFPEPAAAATELARTARPDSPVAITTWTDQGRWLARRVQRLLARVDAVNRPRSAAEHIRTFAEAGLRQQSAQLGGTVLRWSGRRAPN